MAQLDPGPGLPHPRRMSDDRSVRTATCNCGALRAECRGAPVRVSICHCLACKRRTGSAFSHNLSFDAAQVTPAGTSRSYGRRADSGNHSTYHFCPKCGSIVHYENSGRPGVVMVPAGALADPAAPEPRVEVFSKRAVAWIAVATEQPLRRE